MTFRVGILDEPLLEFGGNGREIDIRLGLMRHGPLEPERAATVRLGIIGTAETTEGFARFLDRCKVGLDAKESRQPNLFLPFPGLGNDHIPPNYVVERFFCASKATRGEDVQVEYPV